MIGGEGGWRDGRKWGGGDQHSGRCWRRSDHVHTWTGGVCHVCQVSLWLREGGGGGGGLMAVKGVSDGEDQHSSRHW